MKKGLSWPWLGGFFQAEGCVSRSRLDISQKEKEALELIVGFLTHELPNALPIKIRGPYYRTSPLCGGPFSIYRMQLPQSTTAMVLHKLLPHIHDDKRATLLHDLNLTCSEYTINDDWIAGFWEGDGDIWSANCFSFNQKDRTVLDRICNYLKIGHIIPITGPLGTSMYRLYVPISLHNVNRIGELLSHVRTQYRLQQLSKVLS